MRKRRMLASRLLFVLSLMCLMPFLACAGAQEEDENASGSKMVPLFDPSYKNADLLREHDLLRGCPVDYFNGKQLRTRYEFALNIDRVFKRLKTGLLEIPEAFPYPGYDHVDVGGVTLEEWNALNQLYTEFTWEVLVLGYESGTCDKYLARLKEIALRTSKISLPVLSEGDLDSYHKYRVDPYLRVAIALQKMGKAHACETLLTLSKSYKYPQNNAAFILCRMLFTATGGMRFRRPALGGSSAMSDWPLDPIEIVDGVPFVIVQGYGGTGLPETPGMYVSYCIQNLDWNKARYSLKSAAEKQKALKKLLSSPKWKHPLTDREKSFLSDQIEENKPYIPSDTILVSGRGGTTTVPP